MPPASPATDHTFAIESQGTMPDGHEMAFIGHDLLRIENQQFVEYWVAPNQSERWD